MGEISEDFLLWESNGHNQSSSRLHKHLQWFLQGIQQKIHEPRTKLNRSPDNINITNKANETNSSLN